MKPKNERTQSTTNSSTFSGILVLFSFGAPSPVSYDQQTLAVGIQAVQRLARYPEAAKFLLDETTANCHNKAPPNS